jgi:hypothetical protein
MAGKFSLKMPDFQVAFRDLLHAVNVRHGTHSFTFLPKEGVLRIFFFALKNLTASAGFDPANLGSKGQHATSRPPKPLSRQFSVTGVSVVAKNLYVLNSLSTVSTTWVVPFPRLEEVPASNLGSKIVYPY